MRRLKRAAAREARASHRATVLRERPVTRAVAEMLTPSTRRLATWSNSLRPQRSPRYGVPVFQADGTSTDLAAVPRPTARLRRHPAVAHDVDARLPKVLTPRLEARYFVDRPHRSSVAASQTTASSTVSGTSCDRSTASGASTHILPQLCSCHCLKFSPSPVALATACSHRFGSILIAKRAMILRYVSQSRRSQTPTPGPTAHPRQVMRIERDKDTGACHTLRGVGRRR